jgi:hypothetical protein
MTSRRGWTHHVAGRRARLDTMRPNKTTCGFRKNTKVAVVRYPIQ